MKKDNVTFESPRKTVMKKKWIMCYLCSEWTIGKPYFNKGKKDWHYYDKDGSAHECDSHK